MNCPSCGAEVVKMGGFCHRCGARLSEPNAAEEPKENNSAMLETPQAPESDESGTATSPQPTRLVEPPGTRPSSEEQELWRGGYCAKDMYETWMIYAGLSVVLLILGAWVNVTWLWWTAVIFIFLMWAYGTLVVLYRKWNVAYRLTNRRFFHEKGILRRRTDRIELIDIDDITVEQSLIDRWVGVGTIKITSSDRTDPVLELKGIQDVRHVADLMDDARLDERRRRGLHIEAV